MPAAKLAVIMCLGIPGQRGGFQVIKILPVHFDNRIAVMKIVLPPLAFCLWQGAVGQTLKGGPEGTFPGQEFKLNPDPHQGKGLCHQMRIDAKIG